MRTKPSAPTLFYTGMRGVAWITIVTLFMVVVLFATWSSCCLWQGMASSIAQMV